MGGLGKDTESAAIKHRGLSFPTRSSGCGRVITTISGGKNKGKTHVSFRHRKISWGGYLSQGSYQRPVGKYRGGSSVLEEIS